jgi:peptide subunit release factor 1 (eRF1)
VKRVHGQTEREKAEAAIGGYRGGGLGVVGPEATLDALANGQVEELLITASVRELAGAAAGAARQHTGNGQGNGLPEPAVESVAAGEAAAVAAETVRLADELITRAAQTSAKITFVEDPQLLAGYGGVAAILRFTI